MFIVNTAHPNLPKIITIYDLRITYFCAIEPAPRMVLWHNTTLNFDKPISYKIVTFAFLWERLPSLDNLLVDSALCKNEPK